MKRLLIILLLSTTSLFGQLEDAFSNFFKYSTVYMGYNLASPMHQEDRYMLSMVDEEGNENWQSGIIQIQKDERDLKPDYDLAFGIRKNARFGYENKAQTFYDGTETSWSDGASVGKVKGLEFLFEADIKRQEGKAAFICVGGLSCSAQKNQAILHFSSRKAMNIDGLGKKIVIKLTEEGMVNNMADLFSLEQNKLSKLDRMGDKSASKLIQAIKSCRSTTLARFIYALGIPEVGETTARALENHFHTLKNIQESTIDKFESISDIGPIVAKNIQSFFSQKNNIKIIEKLLSAGIHFNNRRLTNKSALDNLSFVITGSLESITREKSKEILLSLGAKVGSSISKNTNYLVCGNNPGSKVSNAQTFNIEILTELQFIKLIKSL